MKALHLASCLGPFLLRSQASFVTSFCLQLILLHQAVSIISSLEAQVRGESSHYFFLNYSTFFCTQLGILHQGVAVITSLEAQVRGETKAQLLVRLEYPSYDVTKRVAQSCAERTVEGAEILARN